MFGLCLAAADRLTATVQGDNNIITVAALQ